MNNLDQSLNYPTMTGLKSLDLDELTTIDFKANTIDGDIIYYNRIEGNEIIVDTKLTLTNTGVIAVGNYIISDVELTYLDGVTSNIQKQIDNIAGQDLQFQAQIDNHTNQINDLQISDASQNTLLENLEASVNTYDFRIETLEINDATQIDQITSLQTSDTSQNTAITELQSKTQNITSATTISTNMNKKLVISLNGECLKTNGPHTFWSGFDETGITRYFAIGKESNTSNRLMFSNYTLGETVIQAGSRIGNANLGQNKIITNSNGISLRRGGITAGDTQVTVGEIGAITDGNLRINGTSTNNIILSSGLGEISCESNLLRVGATTANANGRKSNILMYNSTGDNWETQSSAFTETLKTQIGTNASNITILQNSNSSLNSSISALQESDTAQNLTIAFQTTQIDELYEIAGGLINSDTSQNTKITALETKTQNITATTAVTYMSKPLYITSVDAFRMYGNHSYLSGWATSGNTRDWYFGTEAPNVKRLVMQNEKQEGIYLRTGSRSGNSNLGQNKIVTHSNGIQLRRGGITLNDNPIIIGEIGGINTDSHFYINGNGTNNITVDSGIGATNLVTNVVWIGSGTANANGRKSNINMLDSTGNNWETQSSAFTEVHKEKINSLIDAASFGNSKGLISFTQAYWWLQLALNTTSINNFSTSIGSATRSVGEYFNAFGYSNYFDATGTYIYPTPSNFNLTFEMEWHTKTMTAFKQLKSKIAIYTGATLITETQYQGYSYNNYNADHYTIYYKVGPFKHIISAGQKILLFTQFNFQTGNDGTTLVMNGKFTIEKNPL